MSYFRFLGAILAAIVLCISSVSAQSSEGRILGTIRDSSGAVVAGAKISVLNTETSFVRTLVTNSEGDYTAPSLEPGLYKVSRDLSCANLQPFDRVFGVDSTCLRLQWRWLAGYYRDKPEPRGGTLHQPRRFFTAVEAISRRPYDAGREFFACGCRWRWQAGTGVHSQWLYAICEAGSRASD